MAPTQTPYGYEPTWQEKISSQISQNAPTVIGKIIQNLLYAFVKLFRFVGELLRDAIGK